MALTISNRKGIFGLFINRSRTPYLPVPQPPTQKDIARELGISAMTVSLALRKHPKISAATRQRVVEASERMGYRINPYVRAFVIQHRRGMASHQRLPLALLNLWKPPSLWKKECWSRQLHEGCVKRAGELGYSIDEIALQSPGMTARRANQILKSRGIRGVLVAPTPSSHGHLRIDWQHFAASAIGFTLRRPNLHRTSGNPTQAMQLTLHHLKHAGYRRVGLRIGKHPVRRMDGGWTSALLEYQQWLPEKERIPIHYHESLEKDRKEFLAWVKRHRPDVVIGLGLIAYSWLTGAGYSIPGDIGFVHLGWDEELHESPGVEFTGTSIGNRQIGARAVDLVVSQLEHNEYGIPDEPTITMVTPRWIPGNTIRRKG